MYDNIGEGDGGGKTRSLMRQRIRGETLSRMEVDSREIAEKLEGIDKSIPESEEKIRQVWSSYSLYIKKSFSFALFFRI